MRVVEARPVLRVHDHRVIVLASAAKIIFLVIPGSFVEPILVQAIVHPVAPVEQIHHRGLAIGRRRKREVQRIIKNPVRPPLRARQVRQIVRVAIQTRIDVVPARFTVAVVDPADRRGVG